MNKQVDILENGTVVFGKELMDRIQLLISRFPEGRSKSAIITILHEVQDHNNHWLPVPVMDKVAEVLGIQPIEVYEVVTFYSMYNTKEVAKYHFEFCHTGPCMTKGVEQLMDYTCKKLGVKPGEITADGLFQVKGVECLGACGYAPMMQLGDFYHEFLTEEKIDQLIEACRKGAVELISKV